MKNARKILLLVMMLVLAISVFAVTAFAAEETPNADGSVTTEYGTFTPTAEQTATAYPLVVFKPDGSVTGLYTNWKEALDAAIANDNSVVYLRADVTRAQGEAHVTSLTAKTRSLTVDLNGHVLTKADKLLFSNYLGSTTSTNTNVTFKNGTMVQSACNDSWRAFINYDYHSTNHKAAATMNYTFDNVKFIDNRATVASQKVFIFAISEYNATVPEIKGKIVYNNCEFYSKGCYVFDCSAGNNYENIDITIEVNGGKVVDSSGLTRDKLIRLNTNGDSVVFGKYNGSYTEFACPTSLAPTSDIFLKDDTGVERVLSVKSDDGTNTVYELVPVADGEDVEVTPYAIITGLSEEKLNKEAYPLAVFKKNGNSYALIDVYATWKAAADVAVVNDGSVIYFRADVVRPAGEAGRNLDGVKASFTVDLNNKTLAKADKYIFDIYLNATTTNTHITFKNGTMAQKACNDDWRAFTQFAYGTKHTVADAVINFTFENVRFEDNRTRAVSDNTGFIFAVSGSSGNLKQTKSVITYNNCEFYTNGTRIFDAYDSNHSTNVDITFNVNGGKIVSKSDVAMNKLVRVSNEGDSVTFGNYNGKYTEFVYPNSVAISNTIKVADDFGNTRVLAKKSNDDANTTYELAEKTPYGLITGLDTADEIASKSPIAVFKDNGNGTYTFGKLYSNWNAAATDARTMNSVIYFRSDVTRPTGEGGVDLDGRTANITVDLNGKTLSVADKYIFDVYLRKTTTDTHVTFKNGTMVQRSCNDDWRAFIYFSYGTNHTVTDAVIDFTFDNVIFKDNRAYQSKNYFIIASNDGVDGAKKTISTVVYNNCEFHTNGTSIFDGYEKRSNVDIAFEVNGGKIISSKNITSALLFKQSTSGDSLTFGKGDNGYTAIELTNGATMDTVSVWNTSDGAECVFVNVPGTTTYTLYPSVMLGYKIKSSVTLYSNFVYNIYVPATSAVSNVYIDGEIVVLDDSMITEIDGADYYRIQVSLPASKTLNDIKVTISLVSGETTVNAKWTLNVVNYAKTVLAGDSSDVEKALVRDMLSYAASAHTYFKTTEDVIDKLSEIANILGENYDENNKVTVPENAAKQPVDNTYFTSVAIYLGEVPSFRFYLASGYEASDFSFTVGGKNVKATPIDTNNDGTADCVEIVMYAYMMLDDVSYTVVNKYTEASVTEYYNLYAYYKYVTSLTGDNADANLVSIVERLMKYVASADAYRESVLNPSTES